MDRVLPLIYLRKGRRASVRFAQGSVIAAPPGIAFRAGPRDDVVRGPRSSPTLWSISPRAENGYRSRPPGCLPFSGEISADRGHHPIPMNEIDATTSSTSAAT